MTVSKTIPTELLDSLLSGYQKPEDLIGENGLLKQLTKALVERALEAEMTDHLGYAKHQSRWTGFDDKIISLYARGLTVREIQSHLEALYGTEVSPTLIFSVTDAVAEEVKSWQSRPLKPIYPIIYLDCIHVKVRDTGAVRVKAVYLVFGSTSKEVKHLIVYTVEDDFLLIIRVLHQRMDIKQHL